jgi:DNA-binding NarL/FixJ family response regulator
MGHEPRLTRSCGGLAALSAGERAATDTRRIRVLTVDDHPLMHEGLAAVINLQQDMELVGEAFTGLQAVELFRARKPDVTLMDLRLPDISGVEATTMIRSEVPGARIIILTTFAGDVEVRRALDAGARSYLLKSTRSKDIVRVIREVHAGKKCLPPEIAADLAEHYGGSELTAREVEVLRLIAAGNRNRDVAGTLAISEETVKSHICHIMEKLNASDRTQAVAIGVRRGIIRL